MEKRTVINALAGAKRGMAIVAVTLAAVMGSTTAAAEDLDMGLWLGGDATTKLAKGLTLDLGAQFRTRNNFQTVERFGVSAGLGYKIQKHLKASAGYILLINNFKESYSANSNRIKWMPSYYGTRHRFFASLQYDVDAGRFNFALRERWQYTYRPGADEKVYRYDVDDETGEWLDRGGKAQHILRTRLKVEYNIPKCPVDPYAYGELFYNGHGMSKYRGFVGAEWKINKTNALDFGFIYQKEAASDGEQTLAVSVNYGIKF